MVTFKRRQRMTVIILFIYLFIDKARGFARVVADIYHIMFECLITGNTNYTVIRLKCLSFIHKNEMSVCDIKSYFSKFIQLFW